MTTAENYLGIAFLMQRKFFNEVAANFMFATASLVLCFILPIFHSLQFYRCKG